MSAEVLAVGPFRRELASLLGSPELHAGTREGAELVVMVFSAPEGSTQSRELAACLNVEPWDFNSHAFDPWAVDLAALRQFSDGNAAVDRFIKLRAAGFEFYFMPNG